MHDQVTGFFFGIKAKIWVFLTDFCFFKATPAQQGKVLWLKNKSEYI